MVGDEPSHNQRHGQWIMDYGSQQITEFLDYLFVVQFNMENWCQQRYEWNIMMISKNEAEDNEMNTEFEIINVPTLSSWPYP